jgi:hypothetical protein
LTRAVWGDRYSLAYSICSALIQPRGQRSQQIAITQFSIYHAETIQTGANMLTKTGEASVQTNSPKADIKITDKNTADNTVVSPPPK